jgi:hypothetical protein
LNGLTDFTDNIPATISGNSSLNIARKAFWQILRRRGCNIAVVCDRSFRAVVGLCCICRHRLGNRRRRAQTANFFAAGRSFCKLYCCWRFVLFVLAGSANAVVCLVDFSVGWVNWRFKRRLLGRRFWQGNQRGLRQIIFGGRWFAGVLRLTGRFGIHRLGRWNFCLRFRVWFWLHLAQFRFRGRERSFK